MAGELDRLLIWMERVDQLEHELSKANPAAQDLIWTQLAPAQRAQCAAYSALVAAAQRGDPEALVAIDALETKIEESTWTPPRPVLQKDSRNLPSSASSSRVPRPARMC